MWVMPTMVVHHRIVKYIKIKKIYGPFGNFLLAMLFGFLEINMDKKIYGNTWNVVWKLKIVVWKHEPNTL